MSNGLYFVGLLLLNIIRVSVSSEPPTEDLGQIVFAHVFFRHGDRMPIEFYPNDPNKDAEWPLSLKQLTDIGKRQQYNLGQWFRKRYSHLLSTTYKMEEIYVESTDFDRTLMSAQCNLAGIYQPIEKEEWNPNIHWQPIPIHIVSLGNSLVPPLGSASIVNCPLHDLEMSRVEQSLEVKQISKRFKNVYDYATEHSGMDVYDFKTAARLFDTLNVEDKYNFSIPVWAKSESLKPLAEAGMYSFFIPTWNHLLQRLKIGPLLGEIVNHFEEKRDGTLTPNRNIWMFSGHDMTLASILNTFGALDFAYIPYASALMIELRRKDQEYFVTMFYRNSTEQKPFLLPMLSCSTLCPLDQFIKLTEFLIPSNWEEECNSVASMKSGIPSDVSLIIWALSLSSLFILLVSLFTCWIKRKPEDWYSNIKPPGLMNTRCKEVIISS